MSCRSFIIIIVKLLYLAPSPHLTIRASWFDGSDELLLCTYLGWWTAVARALNVATAVVGELDPVRRLVQENGSL